MSDLNKVVLYVEKIKNKNLGQSLDNMRHFLMKDYNYDCEEATKLIDKGIVANSLHKITKLVLLKKVGLAPTSPHPAPPPPRHPHRHLDGKQISNTLTVIENCCSLLKSDEKN